MDSKVLESLHYFDGSNDNTMLEIRVWRAAMFSIAEAHRIYSEQLLDALNLMRDFLAEDIQYERPESCTRTAMDRMLTIVTKIASLQTQVWAEFCADSGPYQKLIKWEEDSYDQLKRKSADFWNKHLALEKLTDTDKKLYQKHLQKWIVLHDKLARTMKSKEMSYNEKYASMTGKVDVALTKYQSHFRREVKNRQLLVEQTEEIKGDFVANEKVRLDSLFDAVSDLLASLETVIPKGTDGLEDKKFSPGDINTEEMATKTWNSHLKSYTFQKYKGPSGTDPTAPGQSILTDDDIKKRRKPSPISLFTVVAKDNFLSAEDIGPQPKPSKSQDSKNEVLSPRSLLKKQSSTTTPAPVEDENEESSSFEMLDPAGPNLEPLDLEDNVSLSDSLRNIGLLSEEDVHKPKRKITFANTIASPDVERNVNGFVSLDHPILSSTIEGSYDVLQKFWENTDEHEMKTEKTKTICQVTESSKPEAEGVKSEKAPVITSQKNSSKPTRATIKEDSKNTPVADSSQSNAHRRHKVQENKTENQDISSSSKPVQSNPNSKPEKHGITSGARKPAETNDPDKIGHNDDISSSDQLITEQNQPCSRQDSDKKIQIIKKQSNVSGSSVEEIKLSNSFRLRRRGESSKKPTDSPKKSKAKQTAVESLTALEKTQKNKGEVTVIVLKDRLKQNSNEISIRAGMKIRQQRGANEDGMAYGYKKTKLGLKTHGLYPADLVTLYNTRSEEKTDKKTNHQ